jgi:plasmid stabilization system protein ParE
VAHKIVWTDPAVDDLEAAVEYIARDSEAYAASFAQSIVDAAESLGGLARRGRVVPEWGVSTVRELLVGRYRLIYELEAERVLLVAVIHGSRDLEAAWRERDRR